MKYATRMSRLGTETAFEVMAKAQALEKQGRKIIHLQIGEPDFDTPEFIREAAVDAIRGGWTHYGPSAGLMDVREVIANEVAKTRGTPVDPKEVVVVPGGKPIMFFAMMALLDEGDEAIYPNPGFPIYESMINFLGAKAVALPLLEKNDFAFDLDELERLITPKTKLLVLNSPANPTGGVFDRKTMDRIAEIVSKHDFYILSDEIYSRILYDQEFISISSYPGLKERTIILDGFSKTYAMTGWRLGYGVMEPTLAAHVTRLQTNSNSCTNSFVQKAGAAALTGSQEGVEAMVAEFRVRREHIVKGLNELPGFTCRMPKGAFYTFPNITGTGMKSQELADALLQDAGVACLSGTSFGAHGEGYLRISYANSLENIDKALAIIGEYLTVNAKG